MSELTQCNFCTLERIREDAAKTNSQVVLRDGTGKLKGVNVYLIPAGVEVPKMIQDGLVDLEGDAFHQQYFIAWFMKLTDYCAC